MFDLVVISWREGNLVLFIYQIVFVWQYLGLHIVIFTFLVSNVVVITTTILEKSRIKVLS